MPISMINCTQYPLLQPNPDISGIGVLCDFLVTAYLTLFCCVAKAILDHLKTNNKSTPLLDRWAVALGDSIVSFSDQQVITGISIIIGGLSQINGGLPLYHWQSVVNLAWFSTMTHLITLTVLRVEVRPNSAIKTLRIISMGVLIVMLTFTIIPISYITNDGSSLQPGNSFPTECLYHPSIVWGDVYSGAKIHPSYNWIYVSLAISILVFGFSTRVHGLLTDSSIFQTLLRIPKGRIWKPIEKTLDKLLDKLQVISPTNRSLVLLVSVGYKFLHAVYAILSASSDVYQSKFWEFTWLSMALAWGTIRIFVARTHDFGLIGYEDDMSEVIRQENIWGFGQVVAVGLLVFPVLSFFEAFYSVEKPSPQDYGRQSQHDASFSMLPKEMIRSFYHRSEADLSNPDETTMRQQLRADPWYPNLVALLYLLSLAVGVSLVLLITTRIGNGTISPNSNLELVVWYYVVWLCFNFVILLVSTLLFLDQDLRNHWLESSIGSWLLSQKRLSVIGWTVVLVILVGVSVEFCVLGVSVWFETNILE